MARSGSRLGGDALLRKTFKRKERKKKEREREATSGSKEYGREQATLELNILQTLWC